MAATTPNYGIPYPTTGDPVTPLESVFANMAGGVDTALGTIESGLETEIENNNTRLIGTQAERLALIPPQRRVGLEFYQTDASEIGNWIYSSSGWVYADKTSVLTLSGTAAERAATTSTYWQFWHDTDGTQQIWVGDRSGGWRRYSGSATVPAGAWAISAAPFYGKTDSITIPTTLESDEYVLVKDVDVFGAFGGVAVAGTTRNVGNTILTVRQMRFANAATIAYTIAWQIVKV